MVRQRYRLPREVVDPRLCRHPRHGWIRSWATWCNCRCPCSLQGSGTRWSLMVPSNSKDSTILWFNQLLQWEMLLIMENKREGLYQASSFLQHFCLQSILLWSSGPATRSWDSSSKMYRLCQNLSASLMWKTKQNNRNMLDCTLQIISIRGSHAVSRVEKMDKFLFTLRLDNLPGSELPIKSWHLKHHTNFWVTNIHLSGRPT